VAITSFSKVRDFLEHGVFCVGSNKRDDTLPRLENLISAEVESQRRELFSLDDLKDLNSRLVGLSSVILP